VVVVVEVDSADLPEGCSYQVTYSQFTMWQWWS